MDEVGAALIAIALVLSSVFIPSAFITGISGQFYRQFALTIAGATIISLIVSLTLSPALCALLLKPHTRRRGRVLVEQADPQIFRLLQPLFRRADARLWLAVGQAGAHRGADAGGLCRRHRLRPQRIPQDAGRLHSAARPRLSHHRHATAAGGVAGAHRRRQPARGRDRAQGAGRRARREHRRLFRRHLHQRAELPARSSSRSIRSRSARPIRSNRPPRSRASCSSSWRRSRTG